MAGNNETVEDGAPQPGKKVKRRPKPIVVPKRSVVVPDWANTTPNGGLPSPWLKLGREMGLDLTAPRSPSPGPSAKPEETVPASTNPVASSSAKTSSEQPKPAASVPPATPAPQKRKTASAKKDAKKPSKRTYGEERDLGYGSNSSEDRPIQRQHHFGSGSDTEDARYRGEPACETPEKRAYEYGAGDDDEEDEYATVYDGDDSGAKMRRY